MSTKRKVHPKIVKCLSGSFCREDVLELLPLANDAAHRQVLKKLALMTATRKQSRELMRNLQIKLTK